MTAPPKVTDPSTLALAPFFVKREGEGYTVISRRSRRAISTSQAGVEAIRLLAEGRTVEHTKDVLGRRYGQPAHAIDLTPLLETLLSSGFVRSLDGRPVASGDERVHGALRLWLALVLWGPLIERALRHLPPRLALPLAYRWFARAPHPALERRIADHLRRAPGLVLTDSDVARIASDNAQALHKQFCDRLLAGSLPERRRRRWLSRQVRVSGLEHLVSAAAGKRGTILCSFHLGSYGLLPLVLGARGVAVTVYAGLGEDARANMAAWLTDRARRGDDYPVRIIGGSMGLRTLARCLTRGETVLLYCDPAPGEIGEGPAARGQVGVPFLGTRIWAARGVAWLARKTGATLLPAVLLWEGRHGHHLLIEPALAAPAGSDRSDSDAVLVAVYGALERYVRKAPEQWLRWREFRDLVAAERAECCAEASSARCI